MDEPKPDDWLPTGWRVEVKVRKNGKKDKFYLNQAKGLKFNSKVEVIRYLSVKNHNSEAKNKSSPKQSAKNVVVEKDVAEGLPPGWIKEIKITKSGRKVRKDPYFIDPTKGHVFRCLKNAQRYVETGEVGRNALKSKDQSNDDEELKDDNISLPSGAKKQQKISAVERSQTMEKGSKLNKTGKRKQVHTSVTEDECSEHASSQCLESASLSETKEKELTEKTTNIEEGSDLTPADEVATKNQLISSEVIKDPVKKTPPNSRKGKTKKEVVTPRRASKRLAGIELDPNQEPKIGNRTSPQQSEAVPSKGNGPHNVQEASLSADQIGAIQKGNLTLKASKISGASYKRKYRSGVLGTPVQSLSPDENKVVPKQNCAFTSEVSEISVEPTKKNKLSGDVATIKICSEQVEAEPKASCTVDTSGITEVSIESSKSRDMADDIATSYKCAGKTVKMGNMGDKSQQHSVPFPMGVIPETSLLNGETSSRATEMSGPSLNLPLADLWTDPCIAFAIQTLTGNSLDPPNYTAMSPQYPSGHVGSGKKESFEGRNEYQGRSSNLVLQGNQPIQRHFELTTARNEKPESPLDMPCADIWRDPCIDFAIKTLTGAIPVGDNTDFIRQPISSSQTEASTSTTTLPLPDVGLDSFRQTNYLYNQFDVTGKPVAFSGGNFNFGNSGGARLHQHSKGRPNEFQR